MIVKQLFIILLALFLGYGLSEILNIPIPANVIGFALLFFALCIGAIKIKQVDKVSDFIIKYLAVFFVTPTIGIMMYFELIGKELVHILVPLMLSIIIGFFTAAKVTEIFIEIAKKRDKRKGLED